MQPDTTIRLLDGMEQYSNDQSKVLEIIYKRTSIFKRIKIGAKKVVLSIPRLIANFIMRLVKMALEMVGLNSVYGIGFRVAKQFVAPKAIISSVLSVITIFFPFLAPFLAISKMMWSTFIFTLIIRWSIINIIISWWSIIYSLWRCSFAFLHHSPKKPKMTSSTYLKLTCSHRITSIDCIRDICRYHSQTKNSTTCTLKGKSWPIQSARSC